MKSTTFVLLVLVSLSLICCDRGPDLPDDADLETFIEVSSRCAYLERAYSSRKDLLALEMEDVELPGNWDSMVDSLLVRYGADPDFWEAVYAEISERSRQPASEEPGNIE
jgi:hypothetical protein